MRNLVYMLCKTKELYFVLRSDESDELDRFTSGYDDEQQLLDLYKDKIDDYYLNNKRDINDFYIVNRKTKPRIVIMDDMKIYSVLFRKQLVVVDYILNNRECLRRINSSIIRSNYFSQYLSNLINSNVSDDIVFNVVNAWYMNNKYDYARVLYDYYDGLSVAYGLKSVDDIYGNVVKPNSVVTDNGNNNSCEEIYDFNQLSLFDVGCGSKVFTK